MPSGELVGTTLKYTTGREVTDGHSRFPTRTAKLFASSARSTKTERNYWSSARSNDDRARLRSIARRASAIRLDRTATERD